MSYMMYLQGQDPLAPLKSVGGDLTKQVNRVGKNVKSMVSNINGITTPMIVGEGSDLKMPGSAQRIYRWIDKDGVIHFGTSKPRQDTKFQTVNINPNVNVVESLKAPVKSKQQITQKLDQVPDSDGFFPMTANPSKIKHMLDQVNTMSADRLQKLEEIQ